MIYKLFRHMTTVRVMTFAKKVSLRRCVIVGQIFVLHRGGQIAVLWVNAKDEMQRRHTMMRVNTSGGKTHR